MVFFFVNVLKVILLFKNSNNINFFCIFKTNYILKKLSYTLALKEDFNLVNVLSLVI